MLARCLTRTQASVSVASTKVALSLQGLSINYCYYYYYHHHDTQEGQMSREQATTHGQNI